MTAARPPTALLVGVLGVGVVAAGTSALITREAYDIAGGGTTALGLALAVARLAFACVLTAPAWFLRRTPPTTEAVVSVAGVAGGDGSTSDVRTGPAPRLPPGTGWATLLGGALLGLHFATWLPSLAFTSIAASTTIVCTGPVWVALMLWAGRGQRPSALTAIGITVAVAGGALVALGEVEGLGEGSAPLLGNALALVAAIAYAAHLLVGQHVQARGLGLWRWTTVVTGVGALTVLPVALVSGARADDPAPPIGFWVAALALTLVPQLVGHSSFTWTVRWLSPTLVSVVILLEPVIATVAAVSLYDEVPGPGRPRGRPRRHRGRGRHDRRRAARRRHRRGLRTPRLTSPAAAARAAGPRRRSVRADLALTCCFSHPTGTVRPLTDHAAGADEEEVTRCRRLRAHRTVGRALAVGLVLALGLTACYPTPQEGAWVTSQPGLRVAVQADSLVAMNDEQWESGSLARNGSLAIWSVSGSQFHHAGAWINQVTPRPDVFVIAQGLNSIQQGWVAWDEAQLDRTISYARHAGLAPRIPCIVLVTMAHGAQANPWFAGEARRGSFHIRNKAASSSVFRLAEWRNLAMAHPEWFVADQVHLTRAGSRAYEALITDAVNRC